MKIKNIHDKFFKKIMANKQVAIDFLKTFVPKDTLKTLNIESLKLTNASYINEQLEESFSDIVFKCDSVSTDEKVQITILLEHKSIIDKMTSVQILKYLTLGYEMNLKNKTDISVIIPILFYHGQKKWTNYSFESLFEKTDSNYYHFIPFYDIFFVDLFQYSDEFIITLSNLFLSSALLTQKYSRDPDALAKKIINIFHGLDPDKERNLFFALTVYYLELAELEKHDIIEKIVYLVAG